MAISPGTLGPIVRSEKVHPNEPTGDTMFDQSFHRLVSESGPGGPAIMTAEHPTNWELPRRIRGVDASGTSVLLAKASGVRPSLIPYIGPADMRQFALLGLDALLGSLLFGLSFGILAYQIGSPPWGVALAALISFFVTLGLETQTSAFLTRASESKDPTRHRITVRQLVAFLPRMAFVIISSSLIAFALTLSIFSTEVDNEVQQLRVSQVQAVADASGAVFESRLRETQTEIEATLAALDTLDRKIALERSGQLPPEQGGSGTAGDGQILRALEAQRSASAHRLEEVQQERDQLSQRAQSARIDALDTLNSRPPGLLEKFSALNSIVERDQIAALGLSSVGMLIALLQLMPSLIALIHGSGFRRRYTELEEVEMRMGLLRLKADELASVDSTPEVMAVVLDITQRIEDSRLRELGNATDATGSDSLSN